MTKPGPSVTSGADTQPGSDSLFPSGFGGGSLIRTGGVGTGEIADGSIASADLNLPSVAAAIAARAELTGTYAGRTLPPGLRGWYAALGSRDANGLRILYGPGGSNMQGQGATTMARRGIERLGARLSNALGMGGYGVTIAPHNAGVTSPTWPVTLGTNITRRFDFGIGLRTCQVPSTSTGLTYTFTAPGGQPLRIYYRQSTGTGTMRYAIDGGSNVDVNTNGSVTEMKSTDTATLSAGSHTIVITCTTAGQDAFIEGLNYNPGASLQLFESGAYGASTATFATNGYGAISAVNPDLCIFAMGLNDQGTNVTPATFQTNITSMLSLIRAQKAGLPVLIVGHHEQNVAATYPWQQYLDVMATVAAADSNAYFVSAIPTLGSIATDTLSLFSDTQHMGDKGHGFFADVLASVLLASTGRQSY